MNKRLSLLGSALLAAGLHQMPASAQSSITLYGLVDVDIDISNQGKGTVAAMQGGGLNSSQFGLKGEEDLGQGYKAIFDIENGFNAANGTLLQNALFGRQAWVGLSSPWGRVMLGRQYSPEYVVNASNDAFVHGLAGGLSNIGSTVGTRTAGLLPAYSTTGRTNNAVEYISPTVQGLTARAMYGFKGAQGTTDGPSLGGGLSYALGPATVDAGYIRDYPRNTAGAVSTYSIGASAVFGPARIMGGYSKDISSLNAGQTTRFTLENLGVQYYLDPSDRLLGQATRIVDSSSGIAQANPSYVAALALLHSLSKRTVVYCAYAQVWNRGGAAYSLGGAIYTGSPATPNAVGRNIQLGIQTAF